MNSRYYSPALALLAVLLLSLGMPLVPGAIHEARAQEEKKKPDFSKFQTRRTPTLSNKVYEKLAKAQLAIEEEDDTEAAMDILDGMLRDDERGRTELNAYERANIWNTYGYIYYNQERYRDATRAYQNVIEEPEGIPLALYRNTLYVLAQLEFVRENYRAAIRRLEDWFEVAENPGPQPWFLLAQAYFQVNNPRRALELAEEAWDLAEEREVAMRESWYLLLRALYYERKNYSKVLEVMIPLVTNWPKKEYWTQLSGIYGELDQEQRQMLSMETAYLQDILDKEKELVNVAYLLLSKEMPYKAAQVLEAGFAAEIIERTSKNLDLLGTAWRSAQETEKALPVMEEAASLSDEGRIYARLAQIYLDNYQYQNAVRAARSALQKNAKLLAEAAAKAKAEGKEEKPQESLPAEEIAASEEESVDEERERRRNTPKPDGAIRRPDILNTVLGISLFNLGEYEDAKQTFNQAKEISEDDSTANLADQWLVYIIREVRRQRLLAADSEFGSAELRQLLLQ